MSIENLKIITGEPAKVGPAVQKYLNDHPNAKILSSSSAFQPGEPIEDEEPKPEKAKKGAKEEAPKEGESESSTSPEQVAAEIKAIRYGPPTLILSVIVARKFQ